MLNVKKKKEKNHCGSFGRPWATGAKVQLPVHSHYHTCAAAQQHFPTEAKKVVKMKQICVSYSRRAATVSFWPHASQKLEAKL